jgi:hypothetical protein
MSVFRSLIVLIFLLLAVGVVNAQEETPAFVTLTPADEGVTPVTEEAPTVIVEETDPDDALIPAGMVREMFMSFMTQMGNFFIIALGIIALIAVVVGLPAFFMIYRSTPAPFKSAVKETALGFLKSAENEVDRQAKAARLTEGELDDELWDWFLDKLKNNRAKLEAFFASESGQPPNPPVITGSVG